MSYAGGPVGYLGQDPSAGVGPEPDANIMPEGGFSSLGTGTQVLIVGGGIAVVGLIGFLAYQRIKVTQTIAEKHGVGGALAFEGGMAAIRALGGD